MHRLGQIFLPILFLISGITVSQVQNDSVTSLDEIILLEDFIEKKAVGITESSSLGTADLEQFSPIDFAAGLNQISGLYVLSGALNTNRITIRGVGARTPFGTDKLRMYFNGIPVTNGTGVSTIEAYDFENMGRIEVVKGPKGTSLGANLGGAIVLTTKPPKVGSTFLNNAFTFGSFNMVKNNLAFRHSEKDFNINLGYNHLQTDGFRQNNSFERDGFLLTSSVRLHEKGILGFLVNYIDYTANIPSSIDETDFQEDPRRAAANWLAARGFEDNKYTLAGLSYSHDFNPDLKTINSVFYTYLDHYEPRPFNILDEFTNGFGFRSITEGKLFKGTFTIGGELYRDEYNWQTFFNQFRDNDGNGSLQGAQLSNNKEFRSQLNLFGVYAFQISDRLQAQVGINFNKTTYDFRDLFNTDSENTSARRDFDPILLPSFALTYAVRNGRFFANVGRGFSNPGLEETLTPEGTINPDIEQEKGMSYELGGVFSLFNSRFYISTSIYRMNITDLLVAERIDEDLFIGRNAGETKHQGIELDMNYIGNISEEWQVIPRVSYSYSDHVFVDFIDGDTDFSGNALAGVPRHRINSGMTFRHTKGFIFNLTHQFVDEIPLTDSNLLSSEAFNVFNAQLRYGFEIFDKLNGGLNFGVNNLFDTNYAQSVLVNAVGFGGNQPRFFYPGNGRNYFAGLRLRYDF
ncbi:TonB-dependent receptor domain-containing protein [Allomuricauda sp. SCSIO 65647]|uniref:TonB-dependent receptor family protein n=1 Tax=Allomuricauda sp. SCSIO 65647 TaxID=2908843 RepID=UPI001F3523D0|nr:TonB-dependent receptor [Muricauda sp. SCSIO 65647]UJH66096.1 TonB-dependent receptor [Muricauda sp. SCSIO 65647]